MAVTVGIGGMRRNASAALCIGKALAEGLDRTAAPSSAKIIRNMRGSSDRTEIAVELKRILGGKGTDVQLRADDILFVPSSASKNAALRSLEAVVQIGRGIAIYRR